MIKDRVSYNTARRGYDVWLSLYLACLACLVLLLGCGGSTGPDGGDGSGGSVTRHRLVVRWAGTGTGSVTGGGLLCQAECNASFPDGTEVTLTAAPGTGAVFGGWTDCDSASGATCTVRMGSDRNVTATFNPAAATMRTLTVARAGSGAGTVTGPGIACGADCTEPYPAGSTVALVATASSGAVLAGWAGCDSSSGTTCNVTMNADRGVTATFDQICVPNATRCVAGNIALVESCSGAGWVQSSCPARSLCSDGACRTVCELYSAPTNPVLCVVPNNDGVNNGEYALWTDSRLALSVYTRAGSYENGVVAPVARDSTQTWPYYWKLHSTSLAGVDFKLSQFTYPRTQQLTFRAHRAATGVTNYFRVTVLKGTTTIASCTTAAVPSAWGTFLCTNGSPYNTQLDYGGGWNSMYLSINGDDWLFANYVLLTISP